MGNKHAKNTVIVLDQSLIKSPAWMSLPGKAAHIYLIFRTKMQWEYPDRRGNKTPICTNNGEIIFTYQEADAKYGVGKDCFTAGIDALINRGFIDISAGGGLLKTASRYFIGERWRKWGTPEFVPHERMKIRRGFCTPKSTRENPPNITRENPPNKEIITRENPPNKKRKLKSHNPYVGEYSCS